LITNAQGQQSQHNGQQLSASQQQQQTQQQQLAAATAQLLRIQTPTGQVITMPGI